ncbi:MAG: hypothetical protein NVS9B8_08660 [Candidatus Limnocylindrales bacterium]
MAVAVGCALVAIALFVYTVSHPYRFYNHFEWQALAFLEGHAAIRFPVEASGSSPGNAFFQDVLPVATTDGVARGLVPFPPLPAIVLVPFVALWGLATNGQLIFAILGALDVGIAWWMLGRLPIRPWVRLAVGVFLGFGTVLWYAAQIGTTWYQAHVLAVGLSLAAIGVALGADRTAASTIGRVAAGRPALRGLLPDRRQFLAGLLFGLACTSRLTVVFAAPFFVLVGGGARWQRRAWSAGLGAGIPIGLLLVYNLVTTGHVLHPGYQYLYQLEAGFYTSLNYHLDWSIEDVRYIPQNLGIMLFNGPVWWPSTVPSALGLGAPLCVDPGAVRGLFNTACPVVLPKDTGMSIILTSPAYLLGLPALRWGFGRSRLVTGAAIAVLAIALVNLMHFSQGWVQFGYRFSLDFAPWAVLLVAIGLERLAHRASLGRGRPSAPTPATPGAATGQIADPADSDAGSDRSTAMGLVLLAVGLVVVSVLVNLWGVIWGDALGW